MLEKLFHLTENKTTPKTEVIGGITTFLTMAYIIFVNPLILSDAGMDSGAVITATCLAAFLGTILVGLWANVPFAMAPGMGLNAFFTYTLVMGQGLSWQTALGVVFISGIAFLVLTLLGIREKVVNAIPVSLRLSTAAGIGLFICFIGMKNTVEPVSVLIKPDRHIFCIQIIDHRFWLDHKGTFGGVRNGHGLISYIPLLFEFISFYNKVVLPVISLCDGRVYG